MKQQQSETFTLIDLANQISIEEGWTNFHKYCILREQGLRKEALKHLDLFLKDSEKWCLDEKIRFLQKVLTYIEHISIFDFGSLPKPLSDKFVEPTLEEWCKFETSNSDPFRWYGKFYYSENHLSRALKMNQRDNKARNLLLTNWANRITYSVHHLPEGYIGEPYDDLRTATLVRKEIENLENEELKKEWQKVILEDIELIENYIEYLKSNESDFLIWGKANNKRTTYNWRYE